MHNIEDHYYKINRILLLIIGIWPYENSILVKAQRLIVFSLLVSGICVELAIFTTREFNIAVTLEVLSLVFPTLVPIIKYYFFCVNADALKQMLERVQIDWNLLKNKHERKIIESYAEYGRFMTVVTSSISIKYMFHYFLCTLVFIIGIMIIYMISPIVLYTINIYLFQNNNTYTYYIFIPIDYFVNQEKYFYITFLHFITFAFVGMVITVAIATFLGLYLYHVCGLLKIACYRIEHAINIEEILQISPSKREYVMCMKIMRAIKIQQEGMKFKTRVLSSVSVMYCAIILLGGGAVSIYLFRFLVNMKTDRDIREFFLILSMLFGHFLYIFLANNTAQDVSDHCNNVFFAAYSSMWYVAPVRVQKLILFLLQYCTQNFTIIFCGCFVGSLEGVATMLSASLSYFMVIYSTQLKDKEME